MSRWHSVNAFFHDRWRRILAVVSLVVAFSGLKTLALPTEEIGIHRFWSHFVLFALVTLTAFGLAYAFDLVTGTRRVSGR